MTNDCGTMLQVGLSEVGKLDGRVKEEFWGGEVNIRDILKSIKGCTL